jgi:hypothetical protein
LKTRRFLCAFSLRPLKTGKDSAQKLRRIALDAIVVRASRLHVAFSRNDNNLHVQAGCPHHNMTRNN